MTRKTVRACMVDPETMLCAEGVAAKPHPIQSVKISRRRVTIVCANGSEMEWRMDDLVHVEVTEPHTFAPTCTLPLGHEITEIADSVPTPQGEREVTVSEVADEIVAYVAGLESNAPGIMRTLVARLNGHLVDQSLSATERHKFTNGHGMTCEAMVLDADGFGDQCGLAYLDPIHFYRCPTPGCDLDPKTNGHGGRLRTQDERHADGANLFIGPTVTADRHRCADPECGA